MDQVLQATQRRRGYWALAASVVILGLNWPMMKLGLAHVPPFWMAGLRFATSLPFIALYIAGTERRAPRLHRGDLPVIAIVVVAQCCGMMGLMTFALTRVPAGTASILIYTTPLWLFGFDWALSRRFPGGWRFGLSLLSGSGCAVIVLGTGFGTGGQTGGPVWPLLLILLAAGCWALSIRSIGRHRWQGSVIDALFWQCALASVAMLALALVVEGPWAPDLRAVAYLTYIGPVATGAAFGLQFFAGRQLPSARLVIVSTLTPVIGYTAASLALAEPLRPEVLTGGLILLAAVLLSVLPPPRALRTRG